MRIVVFVADEVKHLVAPGQAAASGRLIGSYAAGDWGMPASIAACASVSSDADTPK